MVIALSERRRPVRDHRRKGVTVSRAGNVDPFSRQKIYDPGRISLQRVIFVLKLEKDGIMCGKLYEHEERSRGHDDARIENLYPSKINASCQKDLRGQQTHFGMAWIS